jgi:carbonic anhydrase/acetyltransferase-like protein (isoleucine patch superfamily)
VAPTAVVSGAVTVAAGARILHGAVITAEDGAVTIGRDVVVMENAVVKARAGLDVDIADACLIGPHAHVNGARLGAGCFIATGASLFPGAVAGDGAEVRIRAVVQANSVLEAGGVVPIGWVAVGDPAQILPPDDHDQIWAIQRNLDFNGTVYGVKRGTSMADIMRAQSEFYGAHASDEFLDDTNGPA